MKVNLGSGKNYLQGYVNVDINPMWKPDRVWDVSRSIPSDMVGACEEIIAHDVLEHIPDLVSAMTNCLALLKEGGTMDISVPYYLSLGAWQDPTHVRAFNENSWVYYTDWFWYLGWTEHRFQIEKLEYTVSLYGKTLIEANKNVTLEWLLTMPKAVDAMRVILRKIAVPEEEKTVAEVYYGRI